MFGVFVEFLGKFRGFIRVLGFGFLECIVFLLVEAVCFSFYILRFRVRVR